METFNISLTQSNKKGETTFKAIASGMAADGLKGVSKELAMFVKKTVDTFDKLADKGVSGLSKSRLKASQPLAISVQGEDDSSALEISIANFGKFARDAKEKDVAEVIELLLEYVDTPIRQA